MNNLLINSQIINSRRPENLRTTLESPVNSNSSTVLCIFLEYYQFDSYPIISTNLNQIKNYY